MALVDYSGSGTSSNDEEEQHTDYSIQTSRKRRRIQNLEPASLEVIPSRNFPVVRGNWPTHLYIQLEIDSEEFCDGLSSLGAMLNSFNCSIEPVVSSTKLHISLSRTVVLRMHQIDGFLANVAKRIAVVNSFLVEFGQLKHFENEYNTRSFLGLLCTRGCAELCKLVDHIDASLADFGQPPYYKERCMHASMLSWTHKPAPLTQHQQQRKAMVDISTDQSTSCWAKDSLSASAVAQLQHTITTLVALPAATPPTHGHTTNITTNTTANNNTTTTIDNNSIIIIIVISNFIITSDNSKTYSHKITNNDIVDPANTINEKRGGNSKNVK
eukprot:m.187249 g.187249  ORF g.187249 m.187249 type:complete len:327 (-) comp32296_c1_seq2:193-1173(-)